MKTILFLRQLSSAFFLPTKTVLHPAISKIFSRKKGAIPCALAALQLVLEIIHRIPRPSSLLPLGARLGVQDLLLEILPFRVGGGFLDDDFLVVVRELVDDVFERFAEFELVELGDAVRVDGGSGVCEGDV